MMLLEVASKYWKYAHLIVLSDQLIRISIRKKSWVEFLMEIATSIHFVCSPWLKCKLRFNNFVLSIINSKMCVQFFQLNVNLKLPIECCIISGSFPLINSGSSSQNLPQTVLFCPYPVCALSVRHSLSVHIHPCLVGQSQFCQQCCCKSSSLSFVIWKCDIYSIYGGNCWALSRTRICFRKSSVTPFDKFRMRHLSSHPSR